ncbi:MAG: beta-propeller domain-containing protein [Gammaproteobacteria bacterium]|nr:beta-propeller domain-containing protein [Gammaproteobacteria bacterium]
MTTSKSCNGFLVILASALIAACGSGGSASSPEPIPPVDTLTETPIEKLRLNPSQSCDELKDYVAESISRLLLDFGFVTCLDCPLSTAGATGIATGAAATPEAFDSFTGTNNQESGVDELDLVEADMNGNLYTIDGRHLVIANGLPPDELREIASLKVVEHGFINGLLLDEVNQRLVVATSIFAANDATLASLVAPDYWWSPQVELHFIDVSNPSNPILLRKVLTDGFEIAARRIDDRMHLVTHFSPNMPPQIFEDTDLLALRDQYSVAVSVDDEDAVAALTAQIRERVANIVATYDAQDFLPGLWVANGNAEYTEVSNPNCSVEMPDVSLHYSLTAITSLDTDGANIATTAITNNAWNVYASNDSLYLMQPSNGWWWDPQQRQETAIYKFTIGSGRPAFKAIGKVKGLVYDPFQLSEHNGFLRVATHRNELEPTATSRNVDNNLYVLSDTGGGTMSVVGKVEGFGPNERIFSARFNGDRGFVVTFRRIDPLFSFDLSDPNQPLLMGELEIPGVTTYIHPLGDDHLLTIGFSGDNQGLNPGYQLQIFNVADLTQPVLVHSFTPEFAASGFAWTRASYDHLSFNYFDEAGVLTIPVQYWADTFVDHFSGFAAYRVDLGSGFEELGRLDHSDLARQAYCPDPADRNDGAECELGYYLQAADPRRSVSASVNGQTLIYTFSDVGIKASEANDFENALGVLPLNYPNSYWWWIAL